MRMRLNVSLIIVAGAVACTDVTAPGHAVRPSVQPEWVTSEAAIALDTATGTFRLNYPAGRYVSLASADTVATLFAHSLAAPDPFGIGGTVLENDRGGPIDFARLRVCARATFVETPFGEIPPAVPEYFRSALGPFWAVALCGPDGTAQVSIGVPDAPMDLQVHDDTLVIAKSTGGRVAHPGAGIPARFPDGLPLTPEGAVETLFTMLARRITTIPVPFNQLDDRDIGELPLCASWRVMVESPATVKSLTTGALVSSREFFVRRGPACYSEEIFVYVASAEQPTSLPLAFPADTIYGRPEAGMDTVAVPLSGPVRFERVTRPE